MIAVALAAVSLTLLGTSRSDQSSIFEILLERSGLKEVEATVEHTAPASKEGNSAAENKGHGESGKRHHDEPEYPPCVVWTLLCLGLLKLLCVGFISLNTRRTNRENWNEKAVDYRYLAERLRALNYLPSIGSFLPPAAEATQYASRAVRQSAVDWLFDAMVRSLSPAFWAQPKTMPSGSGTLSIKLITLDLPTTLNRIRDEWILAQAHYHEGVASQMSHLSKLAESVGRWMGILVIGFVAVDVLILILDFLGLFPKDIAHLLHAAAPWLVFLAAVLPAAVASANGIRFQSECRRLADRSALMTVILTGRHDRHEDKQRSGSNLGGRYRDADILSQAIANTKDDDSSNLGAWSVDALLFSESVAHEFVQEVAEWTVLYAKELPEPG